MIFSEWSEIAGQRIFTVSAATRAEGSVESETERVIVLALAAIREAGLAPEHIVRSRLFTRDRESRQQASDIRRKMLAGSLRGASSSFFDARRLPEEARVRVDLSVLDAPAGAAKEVVEYDPEIAPPRSVRLGGLVFLSGVTDTAPGLAAQTATIAASIRDSLARAGAGLERTRLVSIFLADDENPRDALALVQAHLAPPACPVTLTQVGGYSAPTKRIEIEVTAALA